MAAFSGADPGMDAFSLEAAEPPVTASGAGRGEKTDEVDNVDGVDSAGGASGADGARGIVSFSRAASATGFFFLNNIIFPPFSLLSREGRT